MAALEFLQEPGSNNCPVTLALLELMAKDTSPDVRKCVLNKIQVTDQSLAGEGSCEGWRTDYHFLPCCLYANRYDRTYT